MSSRAIIVKRGVKDRIDALKGFILICAPEAYIRRGLIRANPVTEEHRHSSRSVGP